MKKILIGLAIGAAVGAYAMKKLDDENIPEKIMKSAHEKMKHD